MTPVNDVLLANRAAVNELIAAAERCGTSWSTLARFDRECRACASGGQPVASATFGTVSVEDYARFIELHTRHHAKQMPAAER